MGSIPNIIIAIEGELPFTFFVKNILPLGLMLYLVTILIFYKFYVKELNEETGETHSGVLPYEELKKTFEILIHIVYISLLYGSG